VCRKICAGGNAVDALWAIAVAWEKATLPTLPLAEKHSGGNLQNCLQAPPLKVVGFAYISVKLRSCKPLKPLITCILVASLFVD
jgi:hypothetical protein